MTGLCERLRRKGECVPSCADGSICYICYESNGEDFLEAADRIEALEAAATALEFALIETVCELKAALAGVNDFSDTPAVIEKAEAARALLSDSPQ